MTLSSFNKSLTLLIFAHLSLSAINNMPEITNPAVISPNNEYTQQYTPVIAEGMSYVSGAGNSVTTDKNGNTYISGYTDGDLDGYENNGSTDIFIIKHNSDGNKSWSVQYGSTDTDIVKSSTTDNDGYTYITGYTYGNLETTNSGSDDIFLIKYDTNGTKLWGSQFGTSTSEQAWGVVTDAIGNIYITGYTFGALDGNTHEGEGDIFISKYNSVGERQWTKQYAGNSWSGSPYKNDIALAIDLDSIGNIYITGHSENDWDGIAGDGTAKLIVIKFNSDGNRLWTKLFTGSSLDIGTSIYINDNIIYVAGYTYGSFDGNTHNGQHDIVLLKLDINGNKIWSTQYGTSENDLAYSIISDNSQNIYITGETCGDLNGSVDGYSDITFSKFDSSGTNLWHYQYGSDNPDTGFSLSSDNGGNIYLSGIIASQISLSTFTRTISTNHISGTTEVVDINATDINNDALSYSISGIDSDNFTINSISGVVSFISPSPAPNSYEVDVTVSDGNGGSDKVTLLINVAEEPINSGINPSIIMYLLN